MNDAARTWNRAHVSVIKAPTIAAAKKLSKNSVNIASYKINQIDKERNMERRRTNKINPN